MGNRRAGKPDAAASSAAKLAFEGKLWAAANALRGSTDAAEYKHQEQAVRGANRRSPLASDPACPPASCIGTHRREAIATRAPVAPCDESHPSHHQKAGSERGGASLKKAVSRE